MSTAGKYECVGCGKAMDGGTFLCLTAWCAACYARVGKAAIIAAADEVEGVVNAYRSALLAKKFRNEERCGFCDAFRADHFDADHGFVPSTSREGLTPWGKTPAETFRDRHCERCLGECPRCAKKPNEPHREGCSHVCAHTFQQYAPRST